MAMTGHPFPLTVLRHKALADQHGSGQYNDRDRKHNAELLFHAASLLSVELAHGKNAAERGVGDPTMFGQSNIALDLIVCLVAADDEDTAALEQFIGHFLAILSVGGSTAFQKGRHEQHRTDGRIARLISLAAVAGCQRSVLRMILTPGAVM